MDFQMFKAIVDEATTFGPRSFSLHLFGEPLLWPHILDGIRYIKLRNRQHTVLLTTNGTRLEESCEALIRSGVDEIIWSWREDMQANLQVTRCAAKFPELKKILRVRILKEVTPKEEIERWSTWPKIEIRNLHSYGSTIDTSKWGGDGIATKSSTQEFRHACYHLFYAPAVAWNGDLVICCDDARRLTKLGRFGTMSVAEAWQSKKFQAIRDAHMKGVYPGICKNCDVWKQYPDVFYKWQYQRS
jgi:hypothetical protein